MAKPKEAKAEQPKYKMPPIGVGDTVLWHPNSKHPAVASAVVTQVCDETICCSVLFPNLHNHDPKDGVRHKDFPNPDVIEATDSGCWSYRPSQIELLERLAALESMFLESPKAGE